MIDFICLELPWQYIAMTRNNLSIILIALAITVYFSDEVFSLFNAFRMPSNNNSVQKKCRLPILIEAALLYNKFSLEPPNTLTIKNKILLLTLIYSQL